MTTETNAQRHLAHLETIVRDMVPTGDATVYRRNDEPDGFAVHVRNVGTEYLTDGDGVVNVKSMGRWVPTAALCDIALWQQLERVAVYG